MARIRDTRRRTPVPPAGRGEFLFEVGKTPEEEAVFKGAIGRLAQEQMAERRQFAEIKARHAEEGLPLPQALQAPTPTTAMGDYERKLTTREEILSQGRLHNVPTNVVMNQLKLEGVDDVGNVMKTYYSDSESILKAAEKNTNPSKVL